MRACIVGGGLAGSLLAWRLALATDGWAIDLVLGEYGGMDATAASGGAVRTYERDAEQRRLATASMVELLASQTLRRWAEYREVGSIYLCADGAGAPAGVADIELMLPGSVAVGSAAELASLGWANLPDDAIAVLERHAGYTSPAQLREAVLADGPVRRKVTTVATTVHTITPSDDGAITCLVGGQRRAYDVVVVAAGGWTGALLAASGLPADGYRTKSIQYAIYPADGWRPPHFVDELTGLYGRPTTDGGLLLGVPADQWDVDPARPPTTPALHTTAAALAQDRFPQLRIGPARVRVGAADCYTEHPVMALRRVVDGAHQLFTFSGGSGGAVKTALATTSRAAAQLASCDLPAAELTPAGQRRGER